MNLMTTFVEVLASSQHILNRIGQVRHKPNSTPEESFDYEILLKLSIELMKMHRNGPGSKYPHTVQMLNLTFTEQYAEDIQLKVLSILDTEDLVSIAQAFADDANVSSSAHLIASTSLLFELFLTHSALQSSVGSHYKAL
jgi:hypothetical protein